MKIAAIQMNSGADKARNLAEAERLIREACTAQRPDIVVLPEFFLCLTGNKDGQRASAEAVPAGDSCRALAALARELAVVIHAGTLIERDGEHFYNTAVVFGRDGALLARYRKIHMFDVSVPGGMRIMESETVTAGREVVTYRVGDYTIGCATCYDLRFPELFQALRDAGADIVLLPAAFTLQTGKDHWEVLLRARAIETQVYLFASAQFGAHADGKKICWGHSLAIDPWGVVIAQASDVAGSVCAVIDRDYLGKVRQNLPVQHHHVLGGRHA